MRRKIFYIFTFCLILVLAIFSNEKKLLEVPPRLSTGALYEGKIIKNGLLKFDEDEKLISENLDRNDEVLTKKGTHFYFSNQDLKLSDLLNPAKCINAKVNRTLFFIYSPGEETNMIHSGFYLYPGTLATGNDVFGINNPEDIVVKRGRAFALYADEEALSSCFTDANKISSIPVKNVTENLKPGWVQLAASDQKISTVLDPLKNCLQSVWVQTGDTNFTKVNLSEIENYQLNTYTILWLKTKTCTTEVPQSVQPAGQQSSEQDAVNDGNPELDLINVKDQTIGAIGDGITDDGQALQKALDLATTKTGKVFIPEGNYFINQTLLVDSNTEIYGEGNKTVLIRGNASSLVPKPLWKDGKCEYGEHFNGRVLFWNKNYNCGNENIYLHDFAIDGSKVTTVPAAPTIAFSGNKNYKIENLYMKNLPQDGIFLRGGGQNIVVRNVTIDGALMKYYNGGYINIEMNDAVKFYTQKDQPVLFEGNKLIIKSPKFCQGSIDKTCVNDSDCGNDKQCGATSEITGISITKSNIFGEHNNFPYVKIKGNQIYAGNLHKGISCHHCRESEIDGNSVEAIEEGVLADRRFYGIHSTNSSNMQIKNNTVIGSNQNRDKMGIAASSETGTELNLSFNKVKNKDLGSVDLPIYVRGYKSVIIEGNHIENIKNAHAMIIGNCSDTHVGEATIKNNSFSLPDLVGTVFKPIVLRKMQLKNDIKENTLIQTNLQISETQC